MKPDYEKLCQWHLFHHMWSNTVGTEKYVKAMWRAMDRFIAKPPTCNCEAVFDAAR